MKIKTRPPTSLHKHRTLAVLQDTDGRYLGTAVFAEFLGRGGSALLVRTLEEEAAYGRAIHGLRVHDPRRHGGQVRGVK